MAHKSFQLGVFIGNNDFAVDAKAGGTPATRYARSAASNYWLPLTADQALCAHGRSCVEQVVATSAKSAANPHPERCARALPLRGLGIQLIGLSKEFRLTPPNPRLLALPSPAQSRKMPCIPLDGRLQQLKRSANCS